MAFSRLVSEVIARVQFEGDISVHLAPSHAGGSCQIVVRVSRWARYGGLTNRAGLTTEGRTATWIAEILNV